MNGARQSDGLFFKNNFGFSLLAWIFAWICSTTSIVALLVLVLPMPYKGAAFFGSLTDFNSRPFNSNALEWALEKNSNPENAKSFIHSWAKRFFFSTFKYVAPLFLLGAILLLVEMRQNKFYTKDGVHHYSGLPFMNETFSPWSSATQVTLGCNQAQKARLIYEVKLSNGKTLNMDNMVPIEASKWLEYLEDIDKSIQAAEPSYERWKWLNRNPIHSQCLSAYINKYGIIDIERFHRILRINKLGSANP